MAWLLFLDESGHDHKNTPYEVRGGVALHVSQVWAFVQAMERAELAAFGTELHQFRTELKGAKLLQKERFRWAEQLPRMDDVERRRHCRSFLTKGLEGKAPTRPEFSAYGQACLDMATSVFELLRDYRALIFASAIPAGTARPTTEPEEFLRKDQVFLLERYFALLEHKQEHGILVMDASEHGIDRRYVRRLEAYFQRTENGRYRSAWVVPTPLFVSSELTYPIQAADLAIYCINWGFRLPNRGMGAPTRPEIADNYGRWLASLQYRGESYRHGSVHEVFGIFFVPDPYAPRTPP